MESRVEHTLSKIRCATQAYRARHGTFWSSAVYHWMLALLALGLNTTSDELPDFQSWTRRMDTTSERWIRFTWCKRAKMSSSALSSKSTPSHKTETRSFFTVSMHQLTTGLRSANMSFCTDVTFRSPSFWPRLSTRSSEMLLILLRQYQLLKLQTRTVFTFDNHHHRRPLSPI
jgi:hypothetical protein